MERVCPICNGMSTIHAVCSQCGQDYEESGLPSDYVGPYAPYTLSPMTVEQNHKCLHILICPQCGNQSYALIENDVI